MEEDGEIIKYFDFQDEPSSGSQCTTVGHVVVQPNTVYPPLLEKHPEPYQSVIKGRTLSELHLLYIGSGSGRFTDDNGEEFPVTAGMALLLFPNHPHAYSANPGTGWDEYWLGCVGSYPEWLVREEAFANSRSIIRVGQDADLAQDFTQLCNHARGNNAETKNKSLQNQLLGGVINKLLGRLVVIQNREQTSPGLELSGIADKIRNYLDSNLEADIDMKELPHLAGMGYEALSRLFRQATGMTPHQYYLNQKMALALRLIRSGMTVKEVSYRLSFDSPYYFSRLFKKKLGSPPSAYKSKQPSS